MAVIRGTSRGTQPAEPLRGSDTISTQMNPAGVYIHIPFCRSRCSYCDFATGIYQSEVVERYISSLTKEIAGWQEVEQVNPVDTIYFGGGTPSLLEPAQLEQILTALRARFDILADAEITMEMNPGKLSPARLAEFKSLGINRASFGAQTFDDRELAHLGRSHTAAETRQTFRDLREVGFTNISFDLIAGLPGQTLEGWLENVREALSLGPEHLSFYLLEVHEGTPLAEHIRQKRQPQPDDDLAAEMYNAMLEYSCNAGYEHYEISNLSRPGFESRHNSKYWEGLPYYGFGCSAHSYDGEFRRWANERDPAQYIKLVEAGRNPIREDLRLTEHDRRSEHVFLGLRLMKGISARTYAQSFGVDLLLDYNDEIQKLTAAGLIVVNGDLVRLTRTGALLSNEVFAAFV